MQLVSLFLSLAHKHKRSEFSENGFYNSWIYKAECFINNLDKGSTTSREVTVQIEFI